ncbi:MAG: KEOPS complex kinase/ATPase Bud32 [Candidatus Methanomethylophilaceae archaeon]|nr:KEOPS complex kinase/ATPase Bud32 [Candidatus Methanomethylophilaceae archaeon]
MGPWESEGMQPLSVGAEASIFQSDFLGRKAIVKKRAAKAYRHPVLDQRLRSARTRKEARLLREARRAGVRTPMVYDVDLKESTLVMEFIDGDKVRELLEERPEEADAVCYRIGADLGRLHSNRIAHGDLTTSNMILMPDGQLCFLDISMGESMAELEALGVDIQLFHRAFLSAHSSLAPSYESFLRGYLEHQDQGRMVLERAEEIRNRGRYT